MSDRDHSLLAPSSAWRWDKCALSVTMAQRFPQERGQEAIDGDCAHDAALALLTDGQPPAAFDALPDDYKDATYAYVQSLILKRKRLPNATHRYEWQVAVPSVHPDCFGTADAVAIQMDPPVIDIDDFKTGWRIVGALENLQGALYLQGVLDTVPDFPDDGQLVFRIHQNRPWHPDGPVREWRTTPRLLAGVIRHLAAQALEALGNNPTATIGDHCYRCPGRHACEALRAAGIEVAADAHAPALLELPLDALGAELLYLRHGAKLLAERIEGMEQEITAAIRRGERGTGWQLDAKPGRLDWSVPAEQVIELGRTLGLTFGKSVEAITPAQAVKAGLPEVLVPDLTQRKASSLSLVPATLDRAKAAFSPQET